MEVPRGFTRCDECEGKGEMEAVKALMETLSKKLPRRVICPSCSGSGLLPTEKLREDATAAALTMWGRSFADTADAVLRKVAEHLAREND